MSRHPVAALTALSIALMWMQPAGQQADEWTHYAGNAGSQKYSALDQVNTDTIARMAVAWRWSSPDNAVVTANPSMRPAFKVR